MRPPQDEQQRTSTSKTRCRRLAQAARRGGESVGTTKGILTAEEAEETLGAGEHSLSPLFYAAHDVITGLREISE